MMVQAVETSYAVVNFHVRKENMLVAPTELSHSVEELFNHEVRRAFFASWAAIYNEYFHTPFQVWILIK